MLQQTTEKLRALGLRTMAEVLVEQVTDPALGELSFEERLGLLVDREWDTRENRRLAARLKAARLQDRVACVEDVDCGPARGLQRAALQGLAAGHWITAHQPVVISGPTGSGKTYVACALGNRACRLGHSVAYYRVSRLLEDLALARADGSLRHLLRRLAKAEVLVLDDWGLMALDPGQAQDVLDILEDRAGTGATVIVTQIPVAQWHGRITDPTLADAICDRLVHGSHRIELRGESQRKLRAAKPPTDEQVV
ncbi:MAG: IS21-like element helper ATPase IstB [Chloroflexota bacterium]|nr:IS21-like element helper ATPase IstB [Chloroflexota bacterium]